MAVKNKFTNVELDWAEKQIKSWMIFVEANPFDTMQDRTKLRPTKNGGTMLEVVATIEAQQKSVREIIKDYLLLLEIVERLRTEEAAKAGGTYGDIKESRRMQKKDEEKENGE